ncbi:APC family permease [Intrasporangium calvum]|uniref:APC family permease n=1 Tax=Intrasporangium calvum TaxID=53358 RepID=A0ABT5GCR9_9MICO|nr:APC family permease [Intrasporangium calvum]MDC5695651.1 APC family permease [Intrasporangium calvum]
MSSQTSLARRLSTTDAVHIGVGSMVGAGLFTAFAPAAAAAGALLLLALLVAAVVAFCNATSSAQLAAQYPTSGGTYVYGRERLGHWWGFIAGWGFVIGKTASCAAMAMTFAAYVVPGAWQRPVAIAAVIGLAAVNYHGVTRTARLARVLVAVILALLALTLVAVVAGTAPVHVGESGPVGWTGVTQAAALLFFAFAGYARIATMGEEVTDPRRTIPRAIVISFAVVVPLYGITGWVLLDRLGAPALAATEAPLRSAAETTPYAAWLGPVVIVAAAVAALGALLSLIAGVGRTALAMARERDLPTPLARVHPKYAVPHVAEVALAAIVSLLVLVVDLREVIGFSSFGVLTYYAVANAAALTQSGRDRLYPRPLQVVGLVGCIVLASTVPTESLIPGVAVLVAGMAGRAVVRRARG